MNRVLHLTAHLGGGVGKALSGLVAGASRSGSAFGHTVVTLEEPEKPHFAELIRRGGGSVVVKPTPAELDTLIRDADVVQLEWWHHPATLKALCSRPLPPMRLLVWCHTSGLNNPVVPRGLLCAAQQFLFTSPCSFGAPEVAGLPAEVRERLGVISSCGGFDLLAEPRRPATEALSVGYLGTLGFAKLHPRYVEFLAAVPDPSFRVRLVGDLTNRDLLAGQCEAAGREGMLDFRGYRDDVAAELAGINVLAYLLNPEHYGTAENALLEAMACGVVPVVLDNPAELEIVENGRTGLVVKDPAEFAAAVDWLSRNPAERAAMGMRASRAVRERFAPELLFPAWEGRYRATMELAKTEISFTGIFGCEPSQWFLACQQDRELFVSGREPDRESYAFPGLFEATKGSVFHFAREFPGDATLAAWADRLETFRPR